MLMSYCVQRQKGRQRRHKMPFTHRRIPEKGQAKWWALFPSSSASTIKHQKVKRVSQMEMEMGKSESLSLSVIEQAKEELETLEAQYPNRFRSLKVELQSFIFLHSQNLSLNPSASPSSPSSSSSHKTPSATSPSAATQGDPLLFLFIALL